MASPEPVDSWDLIVPAEGESLTAELRRHGVWPGQRVVLRLVRDEEEEDEAEAIRSAEEFDQCLAGFRFHSGDPTLARRARQIARTEMGTG
jgi:hypothetical protein